MSDDAADEQTVIRYGAIFHPTVPIKYQLCAYVPVGGRSLPAQVFPVNPHDIKDAIGRNRALTRAVNGGCTAERPIVLIDENWLHEWGPQAAQVSAR
jgi:hypothetical protein